MSVLGGDEPPPPSEPEAHAPPLSPEDELPDWVADLSPKGGAVTPEAEQEPEASLPLIGDEDVGAKHTQLVPSLKGHNDPEEQRDLLQFDSGVARRRSAELRALLELWRSSTPEGRPEKITPPADDEERRRLERETIENMRALGYLR